MKFHSLRFLTYMKILTCIFAVFLTFTATLSANDGDDGKEFPEFREVASIPIHPDWKRFTIFVWPYQTNILNDFPLYERIGLYGFQIDRGFGQEKKIEFSRKHGIPYYAGHIADKGFLHLTGKNKHIVSEKNGLVVRPNSLADSKTIRSMKAHVKKNIETVKKGFVVAYAFDDEPSIGAFTSPVDVDVHPESAAWYRKFLKDIYGSIRQLNEQWETAYSGFAEIFPSGFETLRKQMKSIPMANWNFSPWMDFRHFMDFQFATVLSDLTRYANSLDSSVPAGITGGLAPSPWGGYDYGYLSRAVQWMEAYDVYSTNEILRSFWNGKGRLRMQTFFSTNNSKADSWFLWYYFFHGNQGVIAWPEGWFHNDGNEIAPNILKNRKTFKEIQGKISAFFLDPKNRIDPDPIGIYYSQPSLRMGWCLDVIPHGSTWYKRKSSIDNENQTPGLLRNAWCKTLEDLGFQYDFINYLDLLENRVDLTLRFRVIILPKTLCLSEKEALALRYFVKNGGVLVADHLCGLFDAHGKGRRTGILDDLFGIKRNKSRGFLNGKGFSEINGEKYTRPFGERLSFLNGAFRYRGIPVFERGIRGYRSDHMVDLKTNVFPSVLIEKHTGKGSTRYLNLTPVEYLDHEKRSSGMGTNWRSIVSDILKKAGLHPRVQLSENGNPTPMLEAIFWKGRSETRLVIVKNPSWKPDVKNLEKWMKDTGISGKKTTIQLHFGKKVALRNIRTGQYFPPSHNITDTFSPGDGNVYQVEY